MTVIRETGLVVVSAEDHHGSLFQFSLKEGSLVKQEIKSPCKHSSMYVLCLQVAGHEYLAVACPSCRDIKLMNLNRQLNSRPPVEYDVITAFSGQKVYHMCHGEENRIFVLSGGSRGTDHTVLELDTSTTTFTRVRRIGPVNSYGLCYVPDPHRLLVFSDDGEARVVCCDHYKVVWKTDRPGRLLYLPNHEAILGFEWDVIKSEAVVLDAATGSEIKSIRLPDSVRELEAVCLFNNQIIVAGNVTHMGKVASRISYFDLK